MTRINWRDSEHRRDALIVLALFGLGAALNVAMGLIVIWLLQALGLWDVAFVVELEPGQSNREIIKG